MFNIPFAKKYLLSQLTNYELTEERHHKKLSRFIRFCGQIYYLCKPFKQARDKRTETNVCEWGFKDYNKL